MVFLSHYSIYSCTFAFSFMVFLLLDYFIIIVVVIVVVVVVFFSVTKKFDNIIIAHLIAIERWTETSCHWRHLVSTL